MIIKTFGKNHQFLFLCYASEIQNLRSSNNYKSLNMKCLKLLVHLGAYGANIANGLNFEVPNFYAMGAYYLMNNIKKIIKTFLKKRSKVPCFFLGTNIMNNPSKTLNSLVNCSAPSDVSGVI